MKKLDIQAKLERKGESYIEKYHFISQCLKNYDTKLLLVNYLNEANEDYIYEFLHYSHQGQDLMPVEIFFSLIQAGVRIKIYIDSLFFASSIQEHYNPISIYLLEKYPEKINLFERNTYGIMLFEHVFIVNNLSLLQYVLNHYEVEKISYSLTDNKNYYLSNILALMIEKKQPCFIEKMKILDRFHVDINQYLLFDFLTKEKYPERHDVKLHIISPLALAKEVGNEEVINYFTHHPKYILNEYKERIENISYRQYYFCEGDTINQAVDKKNMLNKIAKEVYQIDNILNQPIKDTPKTSKI